MSHGKTLSVVLPTDNEKDSIAAINAFARIGIVGRHPVVKTTMRLQVTPLLRVGRHRPGRAPGGLGGEGETQEDRVMPAEDLVVVEQVDQVDGSERDDRADHDLGGEQHDERRASQLPRHGWPGSS
jgi:hypothetical protein